MRIGVDVGGTNTDAALLSGDSIVATAKVATTEDITTGVFAAIQGAMSTGGTGSDEIERVMVGTTQFTNAFVQRRGLDEVAVVRLALPATASIPPLTGWPPDLSRAMGCHTYLAKGGYEYDGREISALDEGEIREIAKDIGERELRSVAISCPFATVCSAMEDLAAEIIAAELAGVAITKSSDIGSTGLLPRENAAIMNASLLSIGDDVVGSLVVALEKLGIRKPLYISQNDGTLMTAAHARRFPVLTFASGPTNSMRGAALLAQRQDAIVVDIGGTTSDIGVLEHGFPRQSAVAVELAGVRTNFRMPDLLSIGLGGGSRVQTGEELRIGPESVGYDLIRDALVFGGATLTATDVAVAFGYAEIGNRANVAHLDRSLLEECRSWIHTILSEGIDRVKTSAGDQPVILVGGGSCLINERLHGASDQIVPEHSEVANAIGAAIAQVGGEIDCVFGYEAVGRDAALAQAREEAIGRAVEAGAEADTVEVVSVEEVPLTYLPGGSVRVLVKAVGDLASVEV
ncbi:MAG: hydantoinase/oxoprolinase family protein [Acidobacteriota bacterium]|nr:hydantoinase/oxoprolinase family protein [Acidobacteriota bacterium]